VGGSEASLFSVAESEESDVVGPAGLEALRELEGGALDHAGIRVAQEGRCNRRCLLDPQFGTRPRFSRRRLASRQVRTGRKFNRRCLANDELLPRGPRQSACGRATTRQNLPGLLLCGAADSGGWLQNWTQTGPDFGPPQRIVSGLERNRPARRRQVPHRGPGI